MTDLSSMIFKNLPADETNKVVKLLADSAIENGNVVELLRSCVGHYGHVTAVAADYIESLQSKLQTLESLNNPSITSKEA